MKRALIIAFMCTLAAGCGAADKGVMQGYGEADYLYLSSQDSGVVAELSVKEGDAVAAGAKVFRLDPERIGYAASGAQAAEAAAASRVARNGALDRAVQAAEAQAELARSNYSRSNELFNAGFASHAKLDADRAALDAANAQLAQARAERAAASRELGAMRADSGLAQERLSDLDVSAPTAGTIERIYHRPGEVVAAGQPVVSLLAPQNVKVRFFAPEALLNKLAPGARVVISCDGCAHDIPARVSYAATEPQFTPPVIFSLEQREKLVFLIEARPDDPAAIRPGVPVDVRLAS